MGGKIGREHKGCDQCEIRLRRPIEENPADNGGAWRISRLHTSNTYVRNCRHRHARNVPVNHEEAYRILRRFTTTGFIRDVAVASGASDPDLRAELMTAQLMGVVMMRDVLGFKLLAAVDREVLVAQLAVAVDLLLTCDLSLFR